MSNEKTGRPSMAQDSMTVNHIKRGLTTSHLKPPPPPPPAASETSKPAASSEATTAKGQNNG